MESGYEARVLMVKSKDHFVSLQCYESWYFSLLGFLVSHTSKCSFLVFSFMDVFSHIKLKLRKEWGQGDQQGGHMF